jgi:hypothetical protein
VAAARSRPPSRADRSIEATLDLTRWNSDKSWPEVEAASLEIGAQNDSVAPSGSHAISFYDLLTNAERRSYLELRGASHFAPDSSNTTIASAEGPASAGQELRSESMSSDFFWLE